MERRCCSRCLGRSGLAEARAGVTRYLVSPALSGERIDRVVASLTGLPRRRIRALAQEGKLWLGGRAARVLSRQLHTGDVVDVIAPDGMVLAPASQPPTAVLLHEDGWLVVLDKPAGTVTQTPRVRVGGELTAHELVSMHLSWREGQRVEPLLFHRLDRMTSGVLAFARHHQAARALARTWAQGLAEKRYLAITFGDPGPEELRIREPIGRDPLLPGRFRVSRDGRPATTVVQRIAALGELSLILARPLTGRTHQVRVHLAQAGFPVAGDSLYGGEGDVSRPFLHAWRLSLPHPAHGRTLHLESPLPADMLAVLACRDFTADELPA